MDRSIDHTRQSQPPLPWQQTMDQRTCARTWQPVGGAALLYGYEGIGVYMCVCVCMYGVFWRPTAHCTMYMCVA